MIMVVHLKAFLETKEKGKTYCISVEGHSEKLDSLCGKLDIKKGEAQSDTEVFLFHVNLEKAQFRFGENGSNDALNAAIILSQVLVAANEQKRSLSDEMDDIYEKHGLTRDYQVTQIYSLADG